MLAPERSPNHGTTTLACPLAARNEAVHQLTYQLATSQRDPPSPRTYVRTVRSRLYGTYIVPTPAARPQTSGRSPLNFSPSEWGSRQVEAMPWQPCQAPKLGPGSLDCMACTLSANLSVPGAHLFTICCANIPTIRIDLSIPLLICNRGEALRRTTNTCHNIATRVSSSHSQKAPETPGWVSAHPRSGLPGSTPLSSP